MILRDFLRDNTLIANTHDIFDYDVFKTRLISRYGFREIRADLTIEQIQSYAQNTIDVSADYYKNLFAHILNPFETWGETDSGGGKITTSNTGTETTDYTTTTNDSTTTTVSGDNTSNSENSGAENNFKNAYNTPETPTPTDNSTNSATGKTVTRYSDNSTNTRTGETKNGGTRTGSNSGTTTSTNSNDKSGWNNSDALNTMARYMPVYDIIINDVVFAVIDTCINIWG